MEAEEWIPAVRQTWQRDEQGRILVALDESWDPEANGGEGDWAPLQRRSNTYNDQGNVLTSTTEFWDEDAGDYFIYIRRTMTYDSSGEVLLQELSESGLFGPLQPSFRYTYTYESGNLTEIFTENYSSSTEEWNEYRLETRAYDGNAEITERTFHDWDEGAGDWENRDRTLTTYTPDSVAPTEVETIDQMWDPEADGGSGAWVNEQRDVSSYDAAARTATDLEQVWDPAANEVPETG